MNFKEKSLKLHKNNKGKLAIKSKVEVNNEKDLSLVYSPGVAEPCIEIYKDKNKVYDYTNKSNFVAVISDGSAVLGLNDIGPEASLPVMEGKALLFKKFAGIDAFPICIDEKDQNEIVKTVKNISPVFGGINLEDIKAPKCFYIEDELEKTMDIPVFHDDQHGTAITVLAAVKNALKIVNKKLDKIKIVVNGAGAAATAVSKLLLDFGAENLIINDKIGILNSKNMKEYDSVRENLIKRTNPDNLVGGLSEASKGADLFIGLSVGNVLNKKMVSSMADNPIIFALANPEPEILPIEAIEAGAKIVGTGRSDFPNQINNILVFPGVFRGALNVRATKINKEMKKAAANALANLISEKELNSNYIIPKPFDKRVVPIIAKAVSEAAIKTNVANINKI